MSAPLIERYRCWLRVGGTCFLLFPRARLDPAPLHGNLPICTERLGVLLISSSGFILFVDRSAP